MFGALGKRIFEAARALAGAKVLTEENTREAVSKVRLALLDSDVNFQVVKRFIQQVREKIEGQPVVGQAEATFIKLIHDEMVTLFDPASQQSVDVSATPSADPKGLGDGEALFKHLKASQLEAEKPFDLSLLSLKQKFTKIMVCGLQASGKTTTVAKLTRFIQQQCPQKRILVAACDLQRPGAIEQLRLLVETLGVGFYPGEGDPVSSAERALSKAKESYDVLIVDTAGRLHIDEALMHEAAAIQRMIKPDQVLFVANAAQGQDAAKSAKAFNSHVGITGNIITMVDSDAKAGAVMSVAWMTQKPLLFEGTGERIDDFQLFNARSMADRILGMGDTINLARKFAEQMDEKEAKSMQKKLMSAAFTYEDYLKQMQMVKKMGSLSSLMKMIPGMSSMPIDEKGFKKTEAMILSMTLRERRELDELTPSRRRRVARGSGVHPHDLNRMINGFDKMKKMLKDMSGMKQLKGLLKKNFR